MTTADEPLLDRAQIRQLFRLCTRVFPDEPLPDRARLVLADLFEEIGRSDGDG